MIKVLLAVLGAMAFLQVVKADDRFDQANADFEAGRFKVAAEAYEKLLEAGPRVGVLQNLGSAYYRLGENGRAILAFERALLLKPRDPDLRANLKLAQDQAAAFPLETGSGWQKILFKPSRQQWSLMALASALVLPAVAGGWLLLRKKTRWAGKVAASCSAVALAVASLSIHAIEVRKSEQARGIVISDPATLRISPFEKAAEKSSLPGGREVTLGRRENGYFWVSADGGASEGWVAEGQVEPVIPAVTAK